MVARNAMPKITAPFLIGNVHAKNHTSGKQVVIEQKSQGVKRCAFSRELPWWQSEKRRTFLFWRGATSPAAMVKIRRNADSSSFEQYLSGCSGDSTLDTQEEVMVCKNVFK